MSDILHRFLNDDSQLQQWPAYGDWATLRRALIDDALLTRKHDGSEYRRVSEQS